MNKFTEGQKDLILLAKSYAIQCHDNTNHKYGDKPYSHHLQMVYDYACKYCHLLPQELVIYALAAAWAHDTIEDTRQTYNDVKSVLGERVADIVYALTNEKGKTRDERASNKYYSDMVMVEGAVFDKMCDRLANVNNSVNTGSSMAKKYRMENEGFKKHLYSDDLKPMFDELEELLNKIN